MPRAVPVRPLLTAVLLGGLVGAPAVAQNASPEVTTIDGALDLRGAIERSSEHGCSQSFASSSDRAGMRLVVDARGVATLTVDAEHHETFGPSPGRYAAGDHEFTRTTELARAVLAGRATRTAGGIEIRFDQLEASSVRFTGYGSLPLPPATRSAVAATMRCHVARTDVLPSAWSQDERARGVALLACEIDAPPAPLAGLETPTFHFGRGAGVRTVSEERMWDPGPTRAVRVAE